MVKCSMNEKISDLPQVWSFNDTLENYTVPIPVRANNSRPYVTMFKEKSEYKKKKPQRSDIELMQFFVNFKELWKKSMTHYAVR